MKDNYQSVSTNITCVDDNFDTYVRFNNENFENVTIKRSEEDRNDWVFILKLGKIISELEQFKYHLTCKANRKQGW